MKINKTHGFTLVEMLIIAPIVILFIGVFINAIITMTGNVLVTRQTHALAYNIQNALNLINQDVQSSSGFLATNNLSLTTPQGYNNDAVAFDNANSDPAIGSTLILNTYATTSNPISSTRNFVYAADLSNACDSPSISQNAKIMMNIVYFVKNGTLWRRVVAPSYYNSAGCSQPWQQPSCVPGYNPATYPFCKTQDTRLVDGVAASGFTVNYFESGSTTANTIAGDSAQTDGSRQTALGTTNAVSVEIDATSPVAGRNISQSGTIRATIPNLADTSTAPGNPVADWIAVPQADHYGNFYDSVSSNYATVTRAGAKTIYDQSTQHVYDVPANYLGVNPRSDGQGGNEAVVEASTTNYVLQSSFENTTSGWSYQYVANGSVASSTDKSVYGDYSLKITRTLVGSETNVYQSLSGLTASTAYKFSAYVWSSEPNEACIYTFLATTDLAKVCHNGDSTWHRLSGTFVSSATGTVQLRMGNQGPGSITSSYYDAVQVELGTFATSYIPTTTTIITRNADFVTVPTTGMSFANGTWMLVGAVPPSTGSYLVVFRNSNLSAIDRMHITAGTSSANFSLYGDDGVITTSTRGSLTAGTYHTFGGTWSNTSGNIYLYTDGTPSTVAHPDNTTAFGSPFITIGSLNNGGSPPYNPANSAIQRLVVYTNELSSSDVTIITNAIQNGP